MATRGVDYRTPNGFNDLGRLGRDTVVSIEDNTDVTSTDGNSLKRHALHEAVVHPDMRATLQKVRAEMQHSLSTRISDSNRNISVRKRESKKSFNLFKQRSLKHETHPKEVNDGRGHQHHHQPQPPDTSEAYARHVQVGSNNMMLICEPKERERVYYKQVGDRNVMVNLTHSSHFYQLLSLAKEMDKPTIFPLTADGELWFEIKRRSQLRKKSQPPNSCPTGRNSSQRTSVVSDDNNLNVPGYELDDSNFQFAGFEPQPGREPDEGSDSSSTLVWPCLAGVRSADEHDDSAGTMVIRNSSEFDEDAYSTIDIDNRKDSLSLKFEIRYSVKSFDRRHMQTSVLSHEKVRQFLADDGNEFDVHIHDWEYQRESQYACILDGDVCYELGEDGYTTVPDRASIVEEEFYHSQDRGVERSPASPIIRDRQPTMHECEVPPIPPRHYPPYGSGDSTSTSVTSSPSSYGSTSSSSSGSSSDKSRARRNDYIDHNIRPGRGQESQAPMLPPRLTPGTKSPTAPPPFLGAAPLTAYSWYKGTITSDDAKVILKNKPNGTFLVRDATQGVNNVGGDNLLRMTHEYTIEFLDDKGKCKKLKIMKSDNKYHFKDFDATKFEKLPELIQKIITSGLEIHDDKLDRWETISVIPL